MKNFILILFISAMLAACENDSQETFKTSTQERVHELMRDFDGRVDMAAFVADAQQGVWVMEELDITFTNGETTDGAMDGGSCLNTMMLFPDGTCRVFLHFNFSPLIPTLYQEIQWSVNPSDNGLGLYSAQIEEDAKTANYAQYAARRRWSFCITRTGSSSCRVCSRSPIGAV